MRAWFIQKQAPSAHVSRFGLCTNGVEKLGRVRVQISAWKVNLVTSNNRDRPGARLLRNVDLLFFVHVAQEINQATNKRDNCETERDPALGMTTGGSPIRHEPI